MSYTRADSIGGRRDTVLCTTYRVLVAHTSTTYAYIIRISMCCSLHFFDVELYSEYKYSSTCSTLTIIDLRTYALIIYDNAIAIMLTAFAWGVSSSQKNAIILSFSCMSEKTIHEMEANIRTPSWLWPLGYCLPDLDHSFRQLISIVTCFSLSAAERPRRRPANVGDGYQNSSAKENQNKLSWPTKWHYHLNSIVNPSSFRVEEIIGPVVMLTIWILRKAMLFTLRRVEDWGHGIISTKRMDAMCAPKNWNGIARCPWMAWRRISFPWATTTNLPQYVFRNLFQVVFQCWEVENVQTVFNINCRRMDWPRWGDQCLGAAAAKSS